MNRELKEIIKSRKEQELRTMRDVNYKGSFSKPLEGDELEVAKARINKAIGLQEELDKAFNELKDLSYSTIGYGKEKEIRGDVFKRRTNEEERQARETELAQQIAVENKYDAIMLSLSLEKDKEKIFKVLADAGITF